MSEPRVSAQPARSRAGAWALTLLLAGGACAVAAWYATRKNASDRHMATRAAPLRHAWRVGQRLLYDFESRSRARTDLKSLLQGSRSEAAIVNRLTVGGTLSVLTLSATAERVLLSLRLRGPRVFSTFQFPVARVRRELALPAFAVATRAGRVLSLATRAQILPQSNGILRAIVAATQVVLPLGSGHVAWTTEEENTSGRYRARYSLRAREDGRLGIWKTKTGYLRPPAQAGKPQVPRELLPEGSLLAAFDPAAGRLLSLAGREILTTRVAGRTVNRSETSIQVSLLRAETVLPTELESLRRSSRSLRGAPLFVPSMSPASRQAVHRRRVGDTTTEALLRRLEQASARGDPGSADRTDLFLTFRSLAAARPSDCARLGNVLASSKSGGFSMRLLSAALVSAGHASAQKALAAAIRRRLADASALEVLVPDLAMLREPGIEVERILRGIARSRATPNAASMAQLALGAMARSLAALRPERSRALVDWAKSRLRKARGDEAIVQRLLVLGNTGSAAAEELLLRFTRRASARVRGSALWAIRWVPGARADERLAQALRRDTVASVRLEAARALSYRTLTPVSLGAQKEALLTDADHRVQARVLGSLWPHRAKHPDLVLLVRRVARSAASKDLRKQALRLLAALPQH